MANKRKSLSKTTRFEVFKRDGFTCQYCGRSAPDVILEVDHIIPVAEGGDDEIMNLVTSCRDCNRGKSKRKLSDDAVLLKQKAQCDDLNEKRIQMEMMAEWRKELLQLLQRQAEVIDEYMKTCTKYRMSEEGYADIKKLIRRFGFEEVCIAVEIAYDRYYTGTDQSWNEAFWKIGGICYNRRRQREEYGD